MACNACANKHKSREVTKDAGVLGGYKYLNNQQIKARLQAYKRKYCSDCSSFYDCDYKMYLECKEGK